MKAKIEFELVDHGLTKDQMEQKLIEHIFETMDEWTKGKTIIIIEFENQQNETNKSHYMFIN
tara:strand:- start:51 stop:236 length:186 start_codon:yes stop_codon:yes gene_type:complete